MTSDAMEIRSAGPPDHAAFVRLFPLLEVDDPVMEAPRWEAELMPGTLVAVDGDGRAVGYAYWRLLGDVAQVGHLVVAKDAQRGGVGRRLMEVMAQRAKAHGASRWCLNVKPENAPAIALYTRCGFTAAHRTKALRLAWSAVEAAQDPRERRFDVDRVMPQDDDAIERGLGFVPGVFADARKKVGRVLVRLAQHDIDVGAAVFDPAFPGAHPFRVVRPEVALPLLAALRRHARPEHAHVNVVIEGQPDVADLLLERGAQLRHDIVHMTAPL